MAGSRAVPSDVQSPLQSKEIQTVLLKEVVCARKAAGKEESIAFALFVKRNGGRKELT